MQYSANTSAGEEVVEAWRRWQGSIDCLASEHVWTADELRARSTEAAQVLKESGVGPGTCVALALANSAAFPVALLALLELRATPALVFAGTQAAELDRIALELGAPWALHDFWPGLSHLEPGVYAEQGTIAVGPLHVSMLRTGAVAQAADGASLNGVILHPTSGTYGSARFCVRNQCVALAEARNYVDSIGSFDRTRVSATTPLSHAYAYGFCLMASLLTDSTLVLAPAFNPKTVLRREAERPSDILAIVPPMARALARLAPREQRHRFALHAFYAGAACPPDVMAEYRDVFQRELFAIYGTTETGAIATSHNQTERLAGVGRPLRNVAIRLSHQERYEGLHPGAGEIEVSSTSMMQGYLRDGRIVPPGDAWRTQDIGYLDQTGALSLIGRVRDIINLGGMKVDPAQVEAVLRAHAAVLDAAVYPGLHADGTEFVQAAVQLAGGTAGEEVLRRYCLEQLDAYKIPLRFHVVGEIPRTPSGKCLKVRCPGFPARLILP